ncbi:MAG TPA: hypothetical protein DCL43_03420 [Chitinophagaceae bacterium]|nr:hypothetical protein [Chitinophagaceae bacterium]
MRDTFAVRAVIVPSNTSCSTGVQYSEISIDVAPPSEPGVATVIADTVCKGSNGVVTLTNFVGTVTNWESSADGVTYTNINNASGVQYNYSNIQATTWFRAVVQSGVCAGARSTPIRVLVLPPVTPANAGADVILCADSTYQLNANVPNALTLERGFWSVVSGSNINFADSTQPNTMVLGLQPGTNYILRWTISNPVCPPSFNDITITNTQPLINTIDTTRRVICYGQNITVNGAIATGGSAAPNYSWQVLTNGVWRDTSIAATQSLTLFNLTSSITLRRKVTANPCSNVSAPVTIVVQPPISNNNIVGPASICVDVPVDTLQGSLPTGGDGIFTYAWQQSTDSVSWQPIAGANNPFYVEGPLNSTRFYRRLVTTQLCAGAQASISNEIRVLVRPDAKAEWMVLKDTACAPFSIDSNAVKPRNNSDENIRYRWFANGVFYGENSTTNPGYTLVNAGDSVLIKMVAVSRYGCKNDSIIAWFYTPPVPVTNFEASDTVKCGPATISFTNTTPLLNNFTYFWNFGNGQTHVGAQPPAIVFQPNPTFGDTTYIVTLTAFSECDTVSFSRSVRIKSKPKSLFAPSRTSGCSPLVVTFTNSSKGLNVTYTWLFGDGTQLVTTMPDTVTHTYNSGIQDTLYASLIATNECGSDTSSFAIVITPRTVNVDVAINGNEATGCSPHAVRFINRSSGATNFRWDFGDGNILNTTRNIDTITHVYQQAGIFTVRIRATNNCSDTTDIETVRVFASPNADFFATPITACVGDSILFTNQTDTATGYLWSFANGNTSTLTNPWQRYTQPGIYNVSLIATRQYSPGNACRDTVQKQVTVVASLPGLFVVNDSISTCVPFTVRFNNLSVPSVLTVWNFGDGTVDTGDVVQHTYTRVGTYIATMIATDAGGCKYEYSKQIVVNGPSGTWRYDAGFICGNTPVRFEVTAQQTDSILYQFGDGTRLVTNQRIVFHTYVNNGSYIPTATLYNGSNCTVQLNGADTIKVDYVRAGFSYSTTQVCDTTTLRFTDTSRAFNGITRWNWSFGDNTSSNVQQPTKRYTASGDYTIQLIVTSNSGCSDTATIRPFIRVNKTPQATIVANANGCVGQPVQYNALITSADSVSLTTWSFTNGLTINGVRINNIYNAPGNYNARFIAGTQFGCFDTVNASITIHPTPTTTATNDLLICRGQQVQLNATGANTYNWQPLNASLSCTTCANPVASPLTTTQYVVTGTNTFGCATTDTVLITVAQPIQVTVQGDDTLCIGDRTTLTAFGATRYVWSPSLGLNSINTATVIAAPQTTTQYRVIGFDAHNCFQDTVDIIVAVGQYPTVSIGPDSLTLNTGVRQQLNPTVTNGPISTWAWSPNINISCTDCATPVVTVKTPVCYAVKATNIFGCAGTDTICIKPFCENTQVFIANAFTPDGDGRNDKLVVRGQGIKTIRMFKVFNRWGQVVFEKANFSPNDVSAGWDGTIKGVKAPPDVYVYICEVVCDNDVTYTYKGNTALMK